MGQLFKSFGIEAELLLWQIVNFGILFAILWHFFYKRVRKVMRDRESAVSESLRKADELSKKSKDMEEVFNKKMAEQRKEIESIHQNAKVLQEKLSKEIKAKAEEEATRILGEAQARAKHEKEAILQSLELEIKQVAVELASRLIEKKLDPATEKGLINEALEELRQAK